MPQSDYQIRYNRSVKGHRRNERYWQTAKRKASMERFFAKHGGSAAYQYARYHSIQNEAGCYQRKGDFYPGYKILKALETAEIVEV